MARDLDLLRDLLLLADKQPAGQVIQDYRVLQRDDSEVLQHIKLLKDSGLVDVTQGDSYAFITRLTDRGSDVVEHIREDATWNEAKAEMQAKSIPATMDNMLRLIARIVERKFA